MRKDENKNEILNFSNDVIIVRAGENEISVIQDNLDRTKEEMGILAVSACCSNIKSEEELLKQNSALRNRNYFGRCTLGAIRSAGGKVIKMPSRRNPDHVSIEGISAKKLSELFQPKVENKSVTSLLSHQSERC